MNLDFIKHKIRLLLLIICLPLLLGAETSITFQVEGVKGKLLKNIEARLNELAANKSLTDITPEELTLDIEKAMYPYGFFKPIVQINQPNANFLHIIIQPGMQLHINSLSIHIKGEGSQNLTINKAKRDFSVHVGDPLRSRKYEKAKQILLSAAEHQGYIHASFDKAEVIIDKANYTATINLIFNTGTQYFFGQVRFDPTYISPSLLHRFIPFRYGQPYSNEQLLAFNDALTGSGYFKAVTVKPEDNGNLSIPIDVHLQPAARLNYSFGLGFGTDTGIRGQAGMHIVPVNRWGHKFNTVALGSFNENTVQSQYIIPGNKPLIDQYEITGRLSNLHYDTGYSNSLLLSLAQRHNLPSFQRVLSINNLYDRFHYSYQPTVEKFSLFPKASLTWLNKSNQLFTPNGYNVTVNSFFANKSLLSQINFAQTSIDAKAALTLEMLRTRLYFHSIYGVTQIKNINEFPLSLALLLGGSEDLKGYEYNSIGPGKILTYGGFEIQKETKKNWYLVGFFDSGDVYNPDIKFLRKDVGIGLMWVSPVGPIKIGIAQPIDSHFNRAPHKNPRLVINLGPDL